MKKQRKQLQPEEKASILRRHLLDKEPISQALAKRGVCAVRRLEM